MAASRVSATRPIGETDPVHSGVRRSFDLVRAFRLEQADPDAFYRVQAADTLAQVSRYLDVRDKIVLDVGGGAGYFTEAFRAAGARCFLVEPEAGRGVAPWPEPTPDLPQREPHDLTAPPPRLPQGAAPAGHRKMR